MIRVVSSDGIPVQGFEWTWGPQRERCGTVVAKLTYVLNPGVAELAGRHEAIVTQTMLNPRRTGLLRPSDIVPFKQKTDVLLVGVAYPPDSASFAATLTLGSLRTVMHFAETSSPVPLPELRASEQTFSPDSDFLGDIDPTAFQAAPRDSQSTALPYDCEVTLENLHQTHRLLHTTILRHKLVARLDDGPQGALTLTPDTIVFDTNASTCTVTFRGWRTLKNAPKTILVHVEATAVSGSHAAEHAQPPEDAMTKEIVQPRVGQALPFAEIRPSSAPGAQQEPARTAAPSPIGPISYAPASSLATPSDSPWAARGSPPSQAPAPIEAVKSREGPAMAAPNLESVASPKPSIRDAGEALDLVFFDRESVPRLRRVPAWKPLIAELEEKPIDADEDDPTGAKDLEAIEDRREVLEILVHGDVVDASALDQAVSVAVRPDGRYLAPIVLIAGELSTPFDEVETLKATINTASPLVATDEGLRTAIDDAQAFLKLPAESSSAAVTESFSTRIRRAFSASKRPVANGYLEAQTERALLEKRHYQRRDVLGGSRLRTTLRLPHAGKTLQYVTFLPESARTQLPLAARFRVRLIARVHLPFDPAEPELVLEALALARLCPIFRRDSK